jgi:hypothetical protein
MSQPVPGLLLGNDVYILRGAYDPNVVPNLPASSTVSTVALASLFLRTDTGAVYVKTAQPNTWTAITVP